MESDPIPTELKRLALRYTELQFKKTRDEQLNEAEEQEMYEILALTKLSHQKLIKIATNDIVAEE